MSSYANHADKSSLDAARCPLCGGPNQCALAADPTATECWCDTLTFPRELLDQIPSDAVRKSCVCQKCLNEYQESIDADEKSS